MGKELLNLSYEEWLGWVFDHPATEPAWHWHRDADWWNEEQDPQQTAEYLTRLFESAGLLLHRFSPEQIEQGLWFVASSSDHLFALLDPGVPWPNRKRGIEAISILYQQLFAVACEHQLSHRADRCIPINAICYMWWDVCPLPHNTHYPEWERTDEVILDVLRRTLRLPGLACQEGALHGLGHLASEYPSPVQTIIDDYLQSPELCPDLRQYALNARTGSVL